MRDDRPDYVVTLPIFGKRNVLDSEWFARMYVLVQQTPTQAPGCPWTEEPILVFARRDIVFARRS